MKNQVNKLLTKLSASLCTKMALSVSASACAVSTYQPKEPKCLRK
jgi:AgrD protein